MENEWCVARHVKVAGGGGDKWEPRVRARPDFCRASKFRWWQTSVHDLPPCFGRWVRSREDSQRRTALCLPVDRDACLSSHWDKLKY
jgi:hypothetical protein